jgi:hypothetical protein
MIRQYEHCRLFALFSFFLCVSFCAPASFALNAVAAVESSPEIKLETPVKYWGNSSSAKFHKPSCPFAKAMNSRHVVFFHFRREAIEAGQEPCRYCLPPFVKRVRCVLLPRDSCKGADGTAACIEETIQAKNASDMPATSVQNSTSAVADLSSEKKGEVSSSESDP